MTTISVIREDLKDIKYYYSRKALFDKAVAVTNGNEIVNKVNTYNELMKSASPRIYDLYYSLYVINHTQESYSDELGCTPEYVQRLNKKLLKFLLLKINEMEGIE
jgi:hypothetical protein